MERVRDSKKIYVPCEAVGAVIGRFGRMIRRIQHNSGAYVQFMHETEKNMRYKVCRLTGSPEQIKKAVSLIRNVVESVMPQGQGGPPGANMSGPQGQYPELPQYFQQYSPSPGPSQPFEPAGCASGIYHPLQNKQPVPLSEPRYTDYSLAWSEYYKFFGMVEIANIIEEQYYRRQSQESIRHLHHLPLLGIGTQLKEITDDEESPNIDFKLNKENGCDIDSDGCENKSPSAVDYSDITELAEDLESKSYDESVVTPSEIKSNMSETTETSKPSYSVLMPPPPLPPTTKDETEINNVEVKKSEPVEVPSRPLVQNPCSVEIKEYNNTGSRRLDIVKQTTRETEPATKDTPAPKDIPPTITPPDMSEDVILEKYQKEIYHLESQLELESGKEIHIELNTDDIKIEDFMSQKVQNILQNMKNLELKLDIIREAKEKIENNEIFYGFTIKEAEEANLRYKKSSLINEFFKQHYHQSNEEPGESPRLHQEDCMKCEVCTKSTAQGRSCKKTATSKSPPKVIKKQKNQKNVKGEAKKKRTGFLKHLYLNRSLPKQKVVSSELDMNPYVYLGEKVPQGKAEIKIFLKNELKMKGKDKIVKDEKKGKVQVIAIKKNCEKSQKTFEQENYPSIKLSNKLLMPFDRDGQKQIVYQESTECIGDATVSFSRENSKTWTVSQTNPPSKEIFLLPAPHRTNQLMLSDYFMQKYMEGVDEKIAEEKKMYIQKKILLRKREDAKKLHKQSEKQEAAK